MRRATVRYLPDRLAVIAAALPAGSLLANLPRGLRETDARRANEVIATLADRHHLRLVDLWSATGPPWRGKYAADWFHPNDVATRTGREPSSPPSRPDHRPRQSPHF